LERLLRERFERNIEDELGEDQLGFRRGNSNRVVIGMLSNDRPKFRNSLGIVCCFVDWQKAFDRVKWNKLIQIQMKLVLTGAKEN
jgi:hypothetical protein